MKTEKKEDRRSISVNIKPKRVLITRIAVEYELEAENFSGKSIRRVEKDCNIEIPI